MAKISDKLLTAGEQRAIRYRLEYDWLETERTTFGADYREKREKKLQKFVKKANKKLLGPAFEACDKEQYAACQMEEALQAYDVKNRLSYREIHHRAATSIFRAVKEGTDWQPALDRMQTDLEKVTQKRAEKVETLEQEKQAFLKKYTGTDDATYQKTKEALTKEYAALSEKLDAQQAAKLAKKEALSLQKSKRLQKKIGEAKARRTERYSLEDDVILSVRGLKMYFGGLKAVDDLSFTVRKGEIFGLIGPNGAGKTTVFNCITQFYKPTAGELLFRTRENEIVCLTDYQVHDIVLKGIARTFQNLEVVKEVSVLDNLLIAATRQYTSSLVTQMLHLPKLGREEKVIRAKADRILKYMELGAYRDRLAWGLPYGVLKRVEIARALMCNPQLIILDEPAAGLNESETRELAALIDRIRKDFDCTILLVEHDMSLVMNVCDHICAISFGRLLADGTAAEVQASKEVQEAYLGTGGE